jgi:hypothetical protein
MTTKLDVILINELYDKGQSTYILGKLFGVNAETIRRYIKKPRTISETNKSRGPTILKKISESCKKKWEDSSYVAKVKTGTSTSEYKKALSIAGKRAIKLGAGKWVKTEEASKLISETTKKLWQDESYRAKQLPHFSWRTKLATDKSVEVLKTDLKKREAWIHKNRINSSRVSNRRYLSSSQAQLYYILEQSRINFHEEGEKTRIGPFYVVDCIIPKQQNMKKDLIIEVQGEYWHSLRHVQVKDQQKKTYIKNHTDYDLLYIEELDLTSWEEVKAKLAYFGLTSIGITCNINSLSIRKITETDAKMFYSIFHYTATIRKGAITFGAFLNEKLVACISYTYPIRNQIANNLKVALHEVMEISRLARCTNIECPNLLSWFIGNTRSLLPLDVKIIISYSDLTYGHTGGVYKACGFNNDKEIEEDYYYLSINGKYHKKTIWDKSKRLRMSEQEYAHIHNLEKVFTGKKLRWIYHR